jgi:transitional endoplasmic reticulum ATPase
MNSILTRTKSPTISALYVKSLGTNSSADDIRDIFQKARECAPCLLVLEDLDSLVSESVRSCFLNEVDGLERNDGILMVGTTNHLDRLDVGVSKRPSRFDRKYYFALPTLEVRKAYCEFFRKKLSEVIAARIGFSVAMCDRIARATEGFSFAYLQELFVATLTSIVCEQSSTELEAGPEPDAVGLWTHFEQNLEQMKQEMLESRRSIEDMSTNTVTKDARSANAGGTGFGIGP